jgi:hypothetical protein
VRAPAAIRRAGVKRIETWYRGEGKTDAKEALTAGER